MEALSMYSFFVCLLSLGVTIFRLVHVAECIHCSLLFIAESTSLYEHPTVCFFIHLLMDIRAMWILVTGI